MFYTDKTEIKIFENTGELTYPASTDGIKLPSFTNLKTDGEVRFIITNCAVNADGELLDVVVKVTNINTWSTDSTVWIKVVKYINLLNSQNDPGSITDSGNDGYDYRVQLGIGTPISFLLHTSGEGGDCEIIMKYYKAGTYNSDKDTGTEGNITKVIGLFTDVDVKYSTTYSDRFLLGIEGIAPTSGKNYIYYNKKGKKVTDSTNWNVELQELSNGIAVESMTSTDVNSFWYQSSFFMATKNISNSTYSFKYGGKGCGMWYMFASPYPYQMDEPTKKVTQSEATPGDKYTYKISQYIPNNYYGSLFNYSEMYSSMIDDTLFSSFVLTDTFDSSLTIDKSNITIENESGNDRTSWFNITVSNNKVTATAKSAYFEKSDFYNHMYILNVPVTLNSGVNKAKVSNKATIETKLGTNESKEYTTNSVDVKVYYYVTVKHLAEGTNKAIATEETIKKYHGDSYTTSKLSTIPSDYEYSSRTSNYTGTATDNVTVTYYYKLKKATLTVNHLEEGTNKVLATQEVSTLNYTDTYTTSTSSTALATHNLVSTPTNASGTISGDVTVNYYYKKKTATLIVKYLEETTNKEVAPSKSSTVYYTDTYTTSASTEVTSNYELKRKTDNFEGIVSSSTIEVIYYYQKKDSSLETSITKVGPEEVTIKDEEVKYTITYTAKVTDYIGT